MGEYHLRNHLIQENVTQATVALAVYEDTARANIILLAGRDLVCFVNEIVNYARSLQRAQCSHDARSPLLSIALSLILSRYFCYV